MTTMYLIREENHNDLAVAWDRKSAINWLVSTRWLHEETEMWDGYDNSGEPSSKTLKELGLWDGVLDLTTGQLEQCGFHLREIEVAP